MSTRVLCFAAHPDDLEVYMGATLRLLQRVLHRGTRVRAVVVTDGEQGTRQPPEGSRRVEQQAVFEHLGIEGWFLGLPDGALDGLAQLPRHVAAEIADFEPGLVLAPHPSDPHPDHAALARAVQEPCWRWLPARPSVEPSHLVPYDDFEPKAELIRFHASQIPAPGESRAHLPGGLDILERSRERDGGFGRDAGVAFAEPLVGPVGTKAPRLLRDAADLVGGAA